MLVEGLVVSGAAVLVIVLQAVSTMNSRRQDALTAEALKEMDERLDIMQRALVQIKDTCDRTYEMHNHRDTDGVPLWFVPRSWAGTQSKIVDICQQISNTQVLLVQAIERMEQKM